MACRRLGLRGVGGCAPPGAAPVRFPRRSTCGDGRRCAADALPMSGPSAREETAFLPGIEAGCSPGNPAESVARRCSTRADCRVVIPGRSPGRGRNRVRRGPVVGCCSALLWSSTSDPYWSLSQRTRPSASPAKTDLERSSFAGHHLRSISGEREANSYCVKAWCAAAGQGRSARIGCWSSAAAPS